MRSSSSIAFSPVRQGAPQANRRCARRTSSGLTHTNNAHYDAKDNRGDRTTRLGVAAGNRRCRRIRSITAVSSMIAIGARRPPAPGQLQDFVKTMHDAGVKVALGNDAGTPNVPFGWGMHHEMELYVEAGLTPMDAIIAATATGAGQMPPVGEADFGTLETGRVADLIVLNADPLVDIRNTLEIDRVMRLGEWVDRSGLLPAP